MTPRLLIFAGPNGSGKSTLTTPAVLERFGIPRSRYINADEIAVHLSENSPDEDKEERERRAFALARTLRSDYRLQKESFAFETVFSHPSTLLDMQLCKAAGFEVVVIFVTTRNPEINVHRVAGRFLAGGHDVPAERIRNRYHRTMSLLPRILEEANRWFVFDNSDSTPMLVASYDGTERTTNALSSFWESHLIESLEMREAERQFSFPGYGLEVVPAEESSGEYEGEISGNSPFYLFQKVGERLIRHDRILLRGDNAGNRFTIKYRDAVGEILS